MSRAPKRLIVNADDLGRTPGINTGVFEAHQRGLVTSATLMVGFPAAAEAAEQLIRHPGLGVGLHVTLTGARPLLPADQVPSLVDRLGRFPDKPEGHRDPDPEEIAAELEAQLARFRQLTGRLPTHLDSHHHSHRLPIVCDAVAAVARRVGIPVRSSGPAVGRRLAEAGVRTTNAFVEEFFGQSATRDALGRILSSLAPGVSELMCHPAVVDDELRQNSSYAEDRQRELEILTDPVFKRLAKDQGIELIHFGEL